MTPTQAQLSLDALPITLTRKPHSIDISLHLVSFVLAALDAPHPVDCNRCNLRKLCHEGCFVFRADGLAHFLDKDMGIAAGPVDESVFARLLCVIFRIQAVVMCSEGRMDFVQKRREIRMVLFAPFLQLPERFPSPSTFDFLIVLFVLEMVNRL